MFRNFFLTGLIAMASFVGAEDQSLAQSWRTQQVDVHHYVDRYTDFNYYTTDNQPPFGGDYEYHGVAFSLYSTPPWGRNLPVEEVVRLYNPNHNSFYLTANPGEVSGLIAQGWEYDDTLGYIGTVSAPGALKVFRLYSVNSGTHFYTVDRNEVQRRTRQGWEVHSPLGFMYR
jgi:hypothetical protein